MLDEEIESVHALQDEIRYSRACNDHIRVMAIKTDLNYRGTATFKILKGRWCPIVIRMWLA